MKSNNLVTRSMPGAQKSGIYLRLSSLIDSSNKFNMKVTRHYASWEKAASTLSSIWARSDYSKRGAHSWRGDTSIPAFNGLMHQSAIRTRVYLFAHNLRFKIIIKKTSAHPKPNDLMKRNKWATGPPFPPTPSMI